MNVEIVLFVLAYLIGSIPVGYLLVRYATGQNIRELGSGNIGSTNVRRIAGRKLAAITQLLDMGKGVLPVAFYLYYRYDPAVGYFQSILANPSIYGVAIAAILGHDFSIFLKFKGGKGVNTTLGASVLLAPLPIFIAVAVYFITKWLFKYVSLSSMALAISLVVGEFMVVGVTYTLYYLVVCMVLILLLHRTNMDRLLRNQELSS
ncbi:MAG: glycerol-3-phosphate 1-O-acyltransferase PlsY [Phocaeicola sp.]